MSIKSDLARDEGRGLAKKFGGRNESTASFRRKFDHMWELTWRAQQYAKDNHASMVSDVNANLDALAGIAAEAAQAATGTSQRQSADAGRDHLRSFRTAPVQGSYVVFSDIHITDTGNRQDFFARHNKALYLDLLTSYYAPRDFTLIENGDVEELLIYEPDPDQLPNFKTADWSEIFNNRETLKRAQFERIVSDHADYYRVVHDNFIARGAYFRTIGNHDVDLARASYVDEIYDTLGLTWPTASDMVFLKDASGPQMLICHGHQFDAYCVAAHARYAGESFSQGGGWAFQGPDRYWSLDKDRVDFIDRWRDGSLSFRNMLVTDEPSLAATDANVAVAAAGKLIGNLHDPAKWEALLGKNVAWEYFTNSDPQDAFNDEVSAGERWYKFRHMNERRIVDVLERDFGVNGMQLLLGHSHEPRIRAGKPSMVQQVPTPAPGYLNSAAAGRFENLIWGIEVVNGDATLVSWSREGDRIERSVWTEIALPGVRALRAGETTSYDPGYVEPEESEADRFPLEAITNLMFAD